MRSFAGYNTGIRTGSHPPKGMGGFLVSVPSTGTITRRPV